MRLTACDDGAGGKTNDNPGGGGNTPRSASPGLDTSKEMPAGPIFELPTGLTFEKPVLTYSPEDPVEYDNKYPEREKANGSAVALYLVFYNTTNQPVILTLPPGLLFVSGSSKVQNGLIVQSATIEVPPGVRHTSSLNDEYTPGPVIQYAVLQEFHSLLAGKEIAQEDIVTIQFVVMGDGLSNTDRALLQAL